MEMIKPIYLYSTAQLRDLEAYSIEHAIQSAWEMMNSAAAAAFLHLRRKWPDARRLLIFCGGGNNAGDGYLLARIAKQAGLEVQVCYVRDPETLIHDARRAAQAAVAAGVELIPYFSLFTIPNADVIVDALLGIGLEGDVRPPFSEVITKLHALPTPILALDIPSGLNADTGAVQGLALKADLTVTFVGLKTGLLTGAAPEYVGEWVCADLDLPESVFETVVPIAKVLQYEEIMTFLPRRQRSSHKGCYGHVLVIGGDYGMGGAVRMAAEAAMRVGSGLVSVATRPEHVSVVNASRPEIMCHQVSHVDDLEPLLDRATVIVIGPGLGQSEWAKELMRRVLQTEQPKVLDADCLNLLAFAPQRSQDWVLTPHPGEAARLLGTSIENVQSNRYQTAKALQRQYGGVVVLKGVGTLVQAEDPLSSVCPCGNPGMASGGMGDILSGVIGGLIAQGLSIKNAAEAGVFVHAKAADLAALQGGERGLLATDLLNHLRQLVNHN